MKTIHIIVISVGVSVVAVFGVLIGYGSFVQYGEQPTFDPEAIIDAIIKEDYTTGFTLVREADGNDAGYWAGSSRVWYDEETELFWLTARIRDPINRGASIEILRSTDGGNFTLEDTLLTSSFTGTPDSAEESQIIQNPISGKWQFFIALDTQTSNWDIYKLDDIDDIDTDKFDESTAAVIIGQGGKGMWDYAAVKALRITISGNEYIMMYNGVFQSHGRLGAAKSIDGGETWTKYQSNPIMEFNSWGIGSATAIPSGIIRDGSNLFISYDGDIAGIGFASWDTVLGGQATDHNPDAPHTAGVRYLDFIVVNNIIYCYYEFENVDKSRDLVVKTIDLTAEIRS